MKQKIIETKISESIRAMDEKLSKRFINLDPQGYFIIKIDHSSTEIIVEHYKNDIDELGRAINPETGQPIKCKNEGKRSPENIYIGQSAKAVGIQITELNDPSSISKLDHALYLGRELQRAEECLKTGNHFIQD